jgi:hypothetical protein
MANKSLFSRLNRLFSNDVVIRNIGGNQLKVADVNQIQTAGKYRTNSLMDRYTRLYVNKNWNIYNPNQNYQTLRQNLYSDYEAMDTDPIIASTLDIIADETTLKNEQGKLLTIRTPNETIRQVLDNLFYDVLNIEFNLWTWTRQMAKFGDFFLKLEISEKFGVYNVIPYTVYNMARFEGDQDQDNPSKVQFIMDPDGLTATLDPNYLPNTQRHAIKLDNYEVAHFRLLSDANYLPYGRSYIEPGRKIFKQLTLMEDAMLLHRIARSPEKRIFYINVGSIPPNEVENFMQRTINNIKKTPYIDEQTGQYNMKYNMQNMLEDFYIPVRGNDTTTKIDTTPGLTYDGIQDVEYLRDKLFSALKVPKAYLGYEGELNGKATLAAEDIRFARTIERIQRIIESELTKIALVHLYSQGFTNENLTNFELTLSSPSIIYEQEKIALMTEKIDLADRMMNSNLVPSDWIYENIFNFTQEQYIEMRDLVREDKRREFRNSQLQTEGNDPMISGKSYGTPHDLATVYRANADAADLPDGYNEKNPVGRPEEHASFIGTNDDPMGGRDRLGVHGMKGGYPSDGDGETININETLAKSVYWKHRDYFNKKVTLVEEKEEEQQLDLLKETNIKGLDS